MICITIVLTIALAALMLIILLNQPIALNMFVFEENSFVYYKHYYKQMSAWAWTIFNMATGFLGAVFVIEVLFPLAKESEIAIAVLAFILLTVLTAAIILAVRGVLWFIDFLDRQTRCI